MNVILIRSIIEAISFVIISVGSMFGSYEIKEQTIGINNADKNKSSSVINTVIEYKTDIIYNKKIPSGITNVIVEGQDGIVYLDGYGNIYKTLKEKINEIVEVGTGAPGEYVGIATGYGPDCEGCTGYAACKTPNGKWHYLPTDGLYYIDEQYGELKILASDWRKFPCGTVIEINNNDLSTPIWGIVMDTGIAMRNAYERGINHIDIAFESEIGLTFNTNTNTKFSVKRWGW